MTYIAYEKKNFNSLSLEIISKAKEIIEIYRAQGFSLTLRQLYYQFIATDAFPDKWIDPETGSKNTERNYKKLGSIINDARLAGLVDWGAIEDRTRYLRSLSHWENPAEIMETVTRQYRIDKWADQPCRPEVWIEKDALVGVIAGICEELDVPYFACRGYNSQSEQWAAGQRFRQYILQGQHVVVLHLGDHDPSGIDMTRDNQERLSIFAEGHVEVQRLALNFDQVQQYRPPPNPAKITDSRYNGYTKQYGKKSWELDALNPKVITDLIENAIMDILDLEVWDRALERENEDRSRLVKARRVLNKGRKRTGADRNNQ